MSRRRIRITVAALAAGAVAATGLPAVTAFAAPVTPRAQAAPPHAETVRLITGDVVHFTETETKAGSRYRATVVAAPRPGGAKVSFAQWSHDDQFYVVPSDMLPLLVDQLDKRLFDVAGLVDSGLHQRATTPVIVQFDTKSARTDTALKAAAGKMAGAAKVKVKRTLGSVKAVSTQVEPGKALGLLKQLPADGSGATAGRNGVTRIYLDGRVKATDTASMPQIGAPQAWSAGYDGTGQTIAVLDTGIDTAHPDLVGQVTASQNFSTSPDAADRIGHGTHVASIIAGTGAASGGDLKGVAHGAKLLNVKVLGDDGFGDDSAVIDGMEWAAANGGTVINMSLGSDVAGDGTDPLSQALNTITEQTGALFVVAAGNTGAIGRGSVGSPGVADLALTVAAVDAGDQIADFSSWGPRVGDSALKPDVAAPGVEILAARAGEAIFGTPGEDYAASSGTSMAAPHVAGAAALVRQARDDLTGQDIKAVLMGAATDGPNDVWHEGAGRIDIPAAIAQPVVAEPASLSFNVFRHPQADLPAVTKDVVYRNPSNADITLTLASSVTGADGAPARGVNLSATSLVVPAGGKASVEVTVDPAANAVGLYGGAVVATPTGGHPIRTAVGWEVEGPKFDVTVRALDRAGAPGLMFGSAMSLTESGISSDVVAEGQTSLRLDPGIYSFGAVVMPVVDDGSGESSLVLADEVEVSSDLTVTLDARTAVAASLRTPRPSTLSMETDSVDRTNAAGDSVQGFWVASANAFLTPTKRVTLGTLRVSEMLLAAGSTYDYFVGRITDDVVPADRAFTARPSTLATVTTRLRAFTTDQQSSFGWTMWDPVTGGGTGVAAPVTAPSTRTTYLSTEGVRWSELGTMGMTTDGWPGVWYEGQERAFAPRQRVATEMFSQVASPTTAPGVATADAESFFAYLPVNSDSQGRPSFDITEGTTTTMRVYDGDELLGESAGDPAVLAQLPPGLSSVRLVKDVRRTEPWWPLSTRMTGEWTVPLPGAGHESALPLLDVQYAVEALGGYNDVKAGKVSIGLSVTRQVPEGRSTPITPSSIRLQWSADGGATWRNATISGKKGATFTVPSGTSMISLRATARDGAGSAVTETVLDALRVR